MSACSSSFSFGERRVGDLLLWLLGLQGGRGLEKGDDREVGVWFLGVTGGRGLVV